MKKTTLLSTLSLISGFFTSFGNEIPDFNVLDVDGNSHSLYTYLSAGNHVLAKLTAGH